MSNWHAISDAGSSKFREAVFDLLLLSLLIGCVYWKLVLPAGYTILEAPDFANQVLPWLDLQARALRNGEIALWDPYLLGGQPLAAQMQPGVGNPLTYLLLAAPLRNGHINPYAVHLWLVLLHLLAGSFAYLLIRDRNLPRQSAILGGLLFAAAGYPGHTHWPQHLAGILWLPLVAMFMLRRQGVAAGLFLGLSWLSGHPQVPLLATLAAVAALLASRRLLTLAQMLAIAALVSAVAWLPAIEYGRHAVRWVDLPQPYAWNDRIPHHVHERNALPASSLPHFLIPGEQGSMANPLVGGVGLALAALGLLTRWNRLKETRWWALGALLSLGFALARGNPFHGVLYALVPMLDKARTPAAALAITQLCIAVLAACGLAGLVDRAPSPPKWGRRAGLALACVGLAALVLVLFEPAAIRRIPDGLDRLALAAFLWILAGAAIRIRSTGGCLPRSIFASLALLTVFELSASVGFDYRRVDDRSQLSVWRRVDADTVPLATYLKEHAGDRRVELRYEDVLFNFGDWHGIETLAGYLPGVLTNMNALGWWEPRVLSLYGVGYSIGKKPLHAEGQREVASGGEGLKLYELGGGAMPRAWSVHEAKAVASAAEAAPLIVAPGGFPFAETALVTGRAAPELERCTGASDEVRITSRGLHRVQLEVRMACRGLVILSDNNYPGWEARIDGQPTPILTANAALRAVVVPAGAHKIGFEFRPRTIYWGAALSIAGLALALATTVIARS